MTKNETRVAIIFAYQNGKNIAHSDKMSSNNQNETFASLKSFKIMLRTLKKQVLFGNNPTEPKCLLHINQLKLNLQIGSSF